MSRRAAETDWSPTRRERNVLASFTAEAQSLPEPGVIYEPHETDLDEFTFRLLRTVGLIECVDRSGHDRGRYKTDEHRFTWLQRTFGDSATLSSDPVFDEDLEAWATHTPPAADWDATAHGDELGDR